MREYLMTGCVAMTDNGTLWKTIRTNLPLRTWIPIAEIYRAVEKHIALDAEDLDTSLSRTNIPRWRTNVRRVLNGKKEAGGVHTRPHPPSARSDNRGC